MAMRSLLHIDSLLGQIEGNIFSTVSYERRFPYFLVLKNEYEGDD
jgi:hypothetical protein